MIPRRELRKLARDRLKDARVLCENRRYAGSVYLCGYAVELALKARICRTLKWEEFPQTRGEMQDYRSFITHNLDILLSLSGIEQNIKNQCLSSWSIVANWDPDLRYQPIRQTRRIDALNMIDATETVVAIIMKG